MKLNYKLLWIVSMGIKFGGVPRRSFPFESQETVFGTKTALRGILNSFIKRVLILFMKYEALMPMVVQFQSLGL